MKIVIRNHKNIDTIVLPVSATGKMILLGNNGVGKSNILEAIYNGNCTYEDQDISYDGSYLFSGDLYRGQEELFPNENMLKQAFMSAEEKTLEENLLAFLEDSYHRSNRPFMKKMIADALDTLKYVRINGHFDPSPMAITRLILLNKLYQNCLARSQRYIIMVDSPEMFASPLLIDEISSTLNQLQKAGCLIIISTHSDRIISRMFTRFDEIIKILKRSDGKVEAQIVDIDRIISNIKDFYASDEYLVHSFSKSTHIDQAIMDLLENDIESYLITAFRDHIITAFFSNIVILGEGSSEDVLFDYIYTVVHPDWISEKQVGFISCMGKSTMPLYFIFLNGIGVRTLVIYDYDNLKNEVHRAYYDAFNQYHFSNRRMFRSYFLKPDLEGFLNIDGETRIPSLIKPVNIFNSTFLQNQENPAMTELLNLLKMNIYAFGGSNQ